VRVLFFLLGVALTRPALADGPQPIDQLAKVTSSRPLLVDAGLFVGLPTTWQTGLSTGVGAGLSYGRTFALGLRGSWSTATESSIAWTVRHDDIRLRLTGTVGRAAGRGSFSLRLGLGTTLVYEDRVRNQGMRAGLMGSDLENSTLAAMPAGEIEGVVGVHVGGPWLVVLAGGPTLVVGESVWHAGWATQLGIAWQP
jgi:hypothetical protein